MPLAPVTARLAPWADRIQGKRTRYGVTIELHGVDQHEPLVHWHKHSQTGMEWGYYGSGPADLAFSILMEVTGQPSLVRSLYQAYKATVIARLPEDEWTITVESVREWVRNEIADLHEMAAADRVLDRMIAREEDAPDYDDAA